jgi:hypothetical protein
VLAFTLGLVVAAGLYPRPVRTPRARSPGN